jgi:tRNA pseudouridine38-40 synthase
MKRLKLTIEYDGTDYCGWQRQDISPSIQAALEDALGAFLPDPVSLTVAGRTDAGVHARGQVAHMDLPIDGRNWTGDDLAKAINAHLRPQPIAVTRIDFVSNKFHARFDAVNKLYIYKIVTRTSPIVFDRNHVWHLFRPLSVPEMRTAAQFLIGHHDFTSFRDSECQAKNPFRTLDSLEITEETFPDFGAMQLITIYAQARSFLHHQVRNMVGTLVDVGRGKMEPAQMQDILAARDRRAAGQTAPAAGLSLVRIDYPSA